MIYTRRHIHTDVPVHMYILAQCESEAKHSAGFSVGSFKCTICAVVGVNTFQTKENSQKMKIKKTRKKKKRDFLLLWSVHTVTHKHVLSSERVKEEGGGRAPHPSISPPPFFWELVVSFTAVEEPSG